MTAQADGAPEALVIRSATPVGLSISRLVVHPSGQDQNIFSWAIGHQPINYEAIPPQAPIPYALFGDMLITSGDWIVGATATLTFVTDNDEHYDTSTDEGVTALIDRYAPWATHVLWDHVTTAARAAAALCGHTVAASVIPFQTPPATLVWPSTDNDQEDETPDDR